MRPGTLFLDTAGWFAALAPRERGHDSARQAYEDAIRRGHLLLTTPLVIAEMHTLILRWRDPRAGMYFLETTCAGGAHLIVALDDDLLDAARTRWIPKLADKPVSLTDAVSFEVMERERVARALTFDRHFADAGFEILD